MILKVAPLNHEHLGKLLKGAMAASLEQAYLSDGSVGYCLLADGEPVFAGGVVNMQWRRGEAWMLPTDFFRAHVKTCFRYMKAVIPLMAVNGHFRRIQATCAVTVSTSLFKHLGFLYEGEMRGFGPNGETCYMYARLFH